MVKYFSFCLFDLKLAQSEPAIAEASMKQLFTAVDCEFVGPLLDTDAPIVCVKVTYYIPPTSFELGRIDRVSSLFLEQQTIHLLINYMLSSS